MVEELGCWCIVGRCRFSSEVVRRPGGHSCPCSPSFLLEIVPSRRRLPIEVVLVVHVQALEVRVHDLAVDLDEAAADSASLCRREIPWNCKQADG